MQSCRPFGSRLMVLLLVVTGATFSGSEGAYACGDKFLVVGRGVRYARVHASRFPASILVVSEDAEARHDLESILKKAGHRVYSIAREGQLEQALRSRSYDVAMISFSDLQMVEGHIHSSNSRPFVLPFLYEAEGGALPPNEYSCIVKSENKATEVLRTIDAIMEYRLQGKPLHCEKILK
jgi:hypothetical protein